MGLFGFLFKNDDGIIKNSPTQTEASGMIGGSMEIEDIFSIRGRGTAATGSVKGLLRKNDDVIIERQGDLELPSAILAIESFRKSVDEAHDGENVGILLRGVAREQIKRGDVIRKVS